jgi:small subunit ribosomal protein S16
MLKIRFFRTGRKKQPFYKIVVTDKNNPPASGRYVEDVGYYNPLTKESEIKSEKISFWMGKGAQLSDVVKNLLIKKGIIKGKKENVVSLTKKRVEKIASKKPEEKKEEVVEEVKEVVEDVKEEVVEEAVEEKEVVEDVKEDVKEETTETKEVEVEEKKEEVVEEEKATEEVKEEK